MDSENQKDDLRKCKLIIDEIATKFEQDWNLNPSLLVIESNLEDTNVTREDLLRELLTVEIELRSANATIPGRLEFERRFPQDQRIIDEVFKNTIFNGEALTKTDILADDSNIDDETFASQKDVVTRRLDEAEVESADLPCLDTVGDFRLLKKLGRGGMGEVYLAHQISLDRNVALKVIVRDRSQSKTHIARFEIEAKSAASLTHKNIIQVYGFGHVDNRWYIAMPVVDGGTLSDLIADQTENPKIEIRNSILAKIACIADALGYAHNQGIVHRDIKPQNILLDASKTPIIADFGLAKILNEDGITRTSELMGSPMYLSPEQAVNSRDVGPATDIHALGTILYQLISNSFPFKSDTTHGVINRVIHDVPQSPREHNPDIPLDLETIVMKCLEKTPQERYSGVELAEDLRRFLNGEPIVARPTGLPTRLYRWTKRKPLVAGLIATLASLAIVTGFAAFFFFQTSQAEAHSKLATQAKLEVETEAKLQEIELKEQAVLARKKAEIATVQAQESARFAQAQQARAAAQAMEFAFKFGDFYSVRHTVGRSFPMNLQSFDTRYYRSFYQENPPAKSHFITSDWGLYDSELNSKKEKIATVDRAGRIDIWDVRTGKRLVELSKGFWHPTAKRHFARWLVLVGKVNLPGDWPGFPTSIAWESETTLIATTTKGKIQRFDIEKKSSDVVWSSETPLHFVRFSGDQSQMIVADASGKLTILDSKFETIEEADFGCEVTFLRPCELNSGWMVGGANGTLRIYGSDLSLQMESNFSGFINDARVEKDDANTFMLVAAGEEPIQQFKINKNEKQFELALVQQFPIPNRVPGTFSSQVAFDKVRNQIYALDSRNDVHVWNVVGGAHVRSYSLGARLEIRQPSLEKRAKLDVLEKRNGCGLRWIENELLHTSRIGDMKLVAQSDEVFGPKWRALSLKLGTTPELAADPEIPSRIWAMDNEGTLSLVDLAKDKLIASVTGAHTGGRQAIITLANGDVATVGNDRWVKLWRFGNGKIKEIRRIKSETPLISLAIHEGNDLVAAVDENSAIQVWNFSDGKHLKTLRFPGVPKDKSALQDMLTKTPINTGKIAFSTKGKYLAAYGAGQAFRTFKTQDFSLTQLGSKHIASAGGTALIFSSVTENRVLTADEITVARNSIDEGVGEASPNFRLIGLGWTGARDFTVTNDGLRIVSLGKNGEIGMCTPEHMVGISKIVCPSKKGHSIAMSATDAAIAVANTDGSLTWCPLENWENAEEVKQISDGIVHRIHQDGDDFRGRPGEHNLSINAAEHLEQPFLVGAVADLGGNNRLHLLHKKEGNWELNRIRFEGDEEGACSRATLFYSPSGKRVIAVRQLQPSVGIYDGRLMLLYERESGQWASETVVESGNAGFWPILRFDEHENVDQIYFGDYYRSQLLRADRHDGGWKTTVIRGNVGSPLRGQFDAEGTPHFLTRRWAGHNNRAPGYYLSMTPAAEFSYQPIFGNFLLMDSLGTRFAFDRTSDKIFSAAAGAVWKKQTEFSRFARRHSTVPSIDAKDRIWFAECLGDRIVFQYLHDNQWSTGMLKLDQELPRGCLCYPRLRTDGILEIMAYQALDGGFLAVIESFDPVAEHEAD